MGREIEVLETEREVARVGDNLFLKAINLNLNRQSQDSIEITFHTRCGEAPNHM